LSRCWCRIVLSAGIIRVRTEGLGKIDPHGRYVFVANHSSYLDTPALLGQLPCHVRFFAYRRLFDIPFFGAHLKRAGHLPVDSSSARASFMSLAEGARLVAERGISVVLFPEGSRSPHGLREFREGAAYIAIKAGVPAVPIGIVGMRELMPVGSLHIRSGSVQIRIGDPIPTSELKAGDRATLTRRLHGEVARLMAGGSSPQGDFPGANKGADPQPVVHSGGPEGHGMDRP
jgi:1-acyl-sn-glycerol-3-phosphate acyltransferase